MKNIEKNAQQWNLAGWSGGYFDINAQGEVCAQLPLADKTQDASLPSLAQAAQAQGLNFPILLRFTDILQHRAQALVQAFAKARAQHDYQGDYTAVYPIKVNQQRQVLTHLLATPEVTLGLEAGSKPELIATLALSQGQQSVIICNGYKDREYIQLALIGQAMGQRVYIVVEKLSELDIIIEESRKLNIQPLLGFRLRLASLGKGRWQNTGGEKAKFGLSSTQILKGIQTLQAHDLLAGLQLIHMHMGSQIAHIGDIQQGLLEGAQFYAQLRKMGAPIQCVDVGGGLAVDYIGTKTRAEFSMNYTLDEYAYQVVHAFSSICQREALEQPHILTEAGRAMLAHHAVLVTNIVDQEPVNDITPTDVDDDAPLALKDLAHTWQNIVTLSPTEAYHNALHSLQEAQSLFTHGVLDLQQRAQAENLYQQICKQVHTQLNPQVRAQAQMLDTLNEKLAVKIFANFSVFQSLPDVWALDQIFPIMPLSRLNEPLTARGIIQDLTCDSDGQVGLYVDNMGVERSLPLPAHDPQQPYLLGFFLAGAYQETLGDMHNLFGVADSVNVTLDENGRYQLQHAQCGDLVSDVLKSVGFESKALLGLFRRKMAQNALSEHDKQNYLAKLEQSLSAYTYLK